MYDERGSLEMWVQETADEEQAACLDKTGVQAVVSGSKSKGQAVVRLDKVGVGNGGGQRIGWGRLLDKVGEQARDRWGSV